MTSIVIDFVSIDPGGIGFITFDIPHALKPGMKLRYIRTSIVRIHGLGTLSHRTTSAGSVHGGDSSAAAQS